VSDPTLADPDSPIGGQLSPPFPSPLLPFLSPSLPLEVAPLKYSVPWGSAVSSASGVLGGVPAEIEFGAF